MKEFTVVWKGSVSGPYSESQLRSLVKQGDVRGVHTILQGGTPVSIEDFIEQRPDPIENIHVSRPLHVEARNPPSPVPGVTHGNDRGTPAPPPPPPSPTSYPPSPPTLHPAPLIVPRPNRPPKESMPTFDSEVVANPPQERTVPPPPPPAYSPQPSPHLKPAAYVPQQGGPEPPRTSGFAIASMVLGIVGVVGGAFLLVPPVLAIIFGHVALSSCQRDSFLAGRGMAVTGIILGWICIAMVAIWLALLLGAAAM
jgi:hypothetical protein